MIRGTTYEEARVVAMLNQESTSGGPSAAAGTRLLFGGICVHNSSRYVKRYSRTFGECWS